MVVIHLMYKKLGMYASVITASAICGLAQLSIPYFGADGPWVLVAFYVHSFGLIVRLTTVPAILARYFIALLVIFHE